MNTKSHLLPIPDRPNVDESVTADNTLAAEKPSRNRKEALEWLQDAGMGLFIHWSLDVQLGCVISHTLVGASEDYVRRFYEELPKTLRPRRWDFDHLAELARLAGFQYAVLTSKHHNGFCLWDTETTDFSIMNTPYGQDLVQQYTDAFRRPGIKVGLYFSPEDFRFLRSQGLPITRTPAAPYEKPVMEKYKALLSAQMAELMAKYDPDVLFFDGGETMPDENGLTLQQLCMDVAWDMKPKVLITRGAIPTPEQQLPGVGADFAWEGCVTLGTAWQYQPTNERYKTGLHLIRLLTETRAKGGSLLLNIGPDADGELCREQEGILRELALWHFINGEAVHGTRPWVITNEGETWLLRKSDALYAVLFGMGEWDRGQRREVLLKSVRASEKTVVEVLGQSGAETEYRPDLDARTYWEQREDGLFISAMHAQRIYCGVQWRNPLVLKITNPIPAFSPMLVQTAKAVPNEQEGAVTLSAEIETLGSFDKAALWFEWREYPGFALSSYEEGWQRLDAGEATAPGLCCAALTGLKKGVTYQFRAAAGNDQNEMKGELMLFTL